MAVEIKELERVFHYEHDKKLHVLPDPSPLLELDEVIDFYTTSYPELLNGSVEEFAQDGDLMIYKIKTIVGTKG